MRVPPDAGWHHAMNRSGGPIPATAFIHALGEASSTLPVEFHAYCVLSRHYHVLLRAEPEAAYAALARAEAACGLRHGSRPRTIPVAFGRHLTGVSRYIHLNAVDAGLAWQPEQWPYSSFRGYLLPIERPAWLATEAVLGRFGGIGARHRHRAYVYAGLDPGSRDADGRPVPSVAVESAWRIEPVLTAGRVLPAQRQGAGLHALVRAVAAAFDVPLVALRGTRAGGPAAALARGALVHAARAHGGCRLGDVAAVLGYTMPAAAAAAAERFDRHVRLRPALRARIDHAVFIAARSS